MDAPTAALNVEACPQGVEVSPRRITIPRVGTVIIGRTPHADVYVDNAQLLLQRGWGGTRTCGIRWGANGWEVAHFGHIGTILVNGREMENGGTISLQDGDVIEPARGLAFRFRCASPAG